MAEQPLSACGCKKFVCDVLGDHVSTCTAHSGAKKAHDWAVEQLADLFRTTHRVKTQQVVKSRGPRGGDIELATYLTLNECPRSANTRRIARSQELSSQLEAEWTGKHGRVNLTKIVY